jgi:hypothetical protein
VLPWWDSERAGADEAQSRCSFRVSNLIGEIPQAADNLSYGVKATVVCFRGGKAPTRRNLGVASPSRLVPTRTQTAAGTRAGTTMTVTVELQLEGLKEDRDSASFKETQA